MLHPVPLDAAREFIVIRSSTPAVVPVNHQVLQGLEAFLYIPGWEQSTGMQLSVGPLRTHSMSIEFGGLRVLLNSPSVTVLDSGVYEGSGTVVCLVTGGDDAPQYFGPVDLNRTLMVWRPGHEDSHRYTMPGSALDACLILEPSLIELMGWQFENPLIQVSSSRVLLVASVVLVGALRSPTISIRLTWMLDDGVWLDMT